MWLQSSPGDASAISAASKLHTNIVFIIVFFKLLERWNVESKIKPSFTFIYF